METERACTVCGETQPIDEFYKNGGSRGGREIRCKTCRKAGLKKRAHIPKSEPSAEVSGAAPEFLAVEVQESYVISGADDSSIALTRQDIEDLYQWWKIKRKAA